MKTLKTFCLSFLFISFSFATNAQDTSVEYIETEAIIKEINFKVRGRRSSATATVDYKTLEGDSLTSKVKLLHIPFIGALDKEGDIVNVLYNKETPLLLTTKSTSFWQSYGLYLLIGFGIIIMGYRFLKRSK